MAVKEQNSAKRQITYGTMAAGIRNGQYLIQSSLISICLKEVYCYVSRYMTTPSSNLHVSA